MERSNTFKFQKIQTSKNISNNIQLLWRIAESWKSSMDRKLHLGHVSSTIRSTFGSVSIFSAGGTVSTTPSNIEATVLVSSSRCGEEIRNYVRFANSATQLPALSGVYRNIILEQTMDEFPFTRRHPSHRLCRPLRKTNDNAENWAGNNKKSRTNQRLLRETRRPGYPGIKYEFYFIPEYTGCKIKIAIW